MHAWNWLKRTLHAHLDRANRDNFVRTLPRESSLLDVGCGNQSASRCLTYRPDLRYVGIDVQEYNITGADKALMDAYVISSPDPFADGILALGGEFQAVMSSHNLEHCNDPPAVLRALCHSVKEGGLLFLAFPAEATVAFPSRDGCLNFHDDNSHRHLPEFDSVVSTLLSWGFRIERQVRRNRGTMRVLFLVGALLEPWSRRQGRVLMGTWHFWGFESIIVARKLPCEFPLYSDGIDLTPAPTRGFGQAASVGVSASASSCQFSPSWNA